MSETSETESMSFSDSNYVDSGRKDIRLNLKNISTEGIQNMEYYNQNVKVKDSILQSNNSSKKDIYFNINTNLKNAER